MVNIKSLGSNRDANLLYRCKERRKEIVLVDYLLKILVYVHMRKEGNNPC